MIILVIALLGINVQYISAGKPEDAQPPLNVKVANEADNPVPISGDVTVNGTADVNVTNSSSNPIFVSEVGQTIPQPFAWEGEKLESFTVPEDKMLIIEYVTVLAIGDLGGPVVPGTFPSWVKASTNSILIEYTIPLYVLDFVEFL